MRWILLLLAVVVATSLSFAQSTAGTEQNVEADKLYNEGNALYRAGNYAGAIEKYNAALVLARDYKYYYQLGISYKNSRQLDLAISSLLECVKAKPDFAAGHHALGGTYQTRGEYDKAITSFKEAIKLNPSYAPSKKGIEEAYAGKIQELADAGKYEEAATLADEALDTYKDNAKLYLLAARVYNRMALPEKAIEAAQRALTLKTRGGKGPEFFEIGMGYKQMKDWAKARAAFNEARKDPQYARNAQYELDGMKGR
ncbi:MAG: tetratricopeptide repeat protein [Nitrososphaera sp.]|nr:tetratricopeptide repeat protein [Nitrososphaera sp.]MCI0707727.1 tetratricopeptide repeat protein [Ignavibacteriota bacterium]